MRTISSQWWRRYTPYSNITHDFGSYEWQVSKAINKGNLESVLTSVWGEDNRGVIDDILKGQKISPMNIRMTPYVLTLMNENNLVNDPIRKQFLPLASELKNSTQSRFDSLSEQEYSPVSGLVHRYPNKALVLLVSACQLYCAYCTRSYSISGSTEVVKKKPFQPTYKKWDAIFDYLTEHTEIEDIVLSGGDFFMINPEQINYLTNKIIKTKSIRRVRIATKGFVSAPMRFMNDDYWTTCVIDMCNELKDNNINCVIHTHINHPNEITEYTTKAAFTFFQEGITVRNQAVLLKGVNDDFNTMKSLILGLGNMHIQPYYIYMCDQVYGMEHFRTPLKTAIDLEKNLRGITAGFMTPTFVLDLPDGGGKRPVTSFEYYDIDKGISVFRSPVVKPGADYVYQDPKE